jgi:hypothetical protein
MGIRATAATTVITITIMVTADPGEADTVDPTAGAVMVPTAEAAGGLMVLVAGPTTSANNRAAEAIAGNLWPGVACGASDRHEKRASLGKEGRPLSLHS